MDSPFWVRSIIAFLLLLIWFQNFLCAVTSVPSHRHVQDSYVRDLCVDSISGLKPPSPVLSFRCGRRCREEGVAALKGDEVADDAQLFIDLVDHLAGLPVHHLTIVHVWLDEK